LAETEVRGIQLVVLQKAKQYRKIELPSLNPIRFDEHSPPNKCYQYWLPLAAELRTKKAKALLLMGPGLPFLNQNFLKKILGNCLALAAF
jgi:hypothetical protein